MSADNWGIPERAYAAADAAVPRAFRGISAAAAVQHAAPIVVADYLRQITDEHGHWINRDYLIRLANSLDPEGATP